MGAGLVFFGRNRSSSITDLQASLRAILMVLLSGCFLSTRNVLKKIIHHKESPAEDPQSSTARHSLEGPYPSVGNKVMEGLDDFIHVSLGGAFVLFQVTLLAFSLCVLTGSNAHMLSGILSSILSSVIMVLSHSIYNVASLLVLSFVAAPVHSLLNSGKRLWSTIMVMWWFGEAVTPEIILGFIFIAVGVIPSWRSKERFFSIVFFAGLYFNFRRNMTMLDISPDVFIVGKASNTANLNAAPLGSSFSSVGTNQQCKVQFKDRNMRLCHFIPYNGNFGDELGPAVILKLLENKFHCSVDEVPVLNLAKEKRGSDEVCLFSLGSIFHMVRSGDHIWGTGINPSRQKRYGQKNLTVYSVRGPKTEALVRNMYHVKGDIGNGDPGFLVPFLYPKYRITEKSQTRTLRNGAGGEPRICFIPHAQDMGYEELKRLPPEDVISVKNSWRPVVESMMNCDFIASSSLHGIIVANAIGIPARWFQFAGGKTSETEGTFKYEDYFTSMNRMGESPLDDFTQIFDPSIYERIISETERYAIANRTMSSFPYHLFATNDADTPVTTDASKKTLIIIMGTLRGGELAWQSFYKNLLEPNSADLALLVPRNTSRESSSLFNRSKYVWEHDEYEDWGEAIDEVIGGDGTWRHIAIQNRAKGLLGGTKESVKGS